MSRRPVVITLVVLGVIAVAVVVVKVLDEVGDPTPNAGGIPLDRDPPASVDAVAPFEGLSEVKAAIGYDHCLRLVVADTEEERVAGLRGNEADLGPYDGMLFVFQGPTRVGVHHVGRERTARHRVLRERRRAHLHLVDGAVPGEGDDRVPGLPGERPVRVRGRDEGGPAAEWAHHGLQPVLTQRTNGKNGTETAGGQMSNTPASTTARSGRGLVMAAMIFAVGDDVHRPDDRVDRGARRSSRTSASRRPACSGS